MVLTAAYRLNKEEKLREGREVGGWRRNIGLAWSSYSSGRYCLVVVVLATTALVASACYCTGHYLSGGYLIGRFCTGRISAGGYCTSHCGTGRYSWPLTGRYCIGRALVATALGAKPTVLVA